MSAFKIVTLNILNDLSQPMRWEERRTLLAAGLAALDPDFIALQEVHLPENNAQWLADELGGYSVHLCPRNGALRDKEGEAILSRQPVREHHTLDLRTQQRVAHLVKAQYRPRPTFAA
jgi:endonuclease/exonuclease/phosphatase family metal-dependent hydrolase